MPYLQHDNVLVIHDISAKVKLITCNLNKRTNILTHIEQKRREHAEKNLRIPQAVLTWLTSDSPFLFHIPPSTCEAMTIAREEYSMRLRGVRMSCNIFCNTNNRHYSHNLTSPELGNHFWFNTDFSYDSKHLIYIQTVSRCTG